MNDLKYKKININKLNSHREKNKILHNLNDKQKNILRKNDNNPYIIPDENIDLFSIYGNKLKMKHLMFNNSNLNETIYKINNNNLSILNNTCEKLYNKNEIDVYNRNFYNKKAFKKVVPVSGKSLLTKLNLSNISKIKVNNKNYNKNNADIYIKNKDTKKEILINKLTNLNKNLYNTNIKKKLYEDYKIQDINNYIIKNDLLPNIKSNNNFSNEKGNNFIKNMIEMEKNYNSKNYNYNQSIKEEFDNIYNKMIYKSKKDINYLNQENKINEIDFEFYVTQKNKELKKITNISSTKDFKYTIPDNTFIKENKILLNNVCSKVRHNELKSFNNKNCLNCTALNNNSFNKIDNKDLILKKKIITIDYNTNRSKSVKYFIEKTRELKLLSYTNNIKQQRKNRITEHNSNLLDYVNEQIFYLKNIKVEFDKFIEQYNAYCKNLLIIKEKYKSEYSILFNNRSSLIKKIKVKENAISSKKELINKLTEVKIFLIRVKLRLVKIPIIEDLFNNTMYSKAEIEDLFIFYFENKLDVNSICINLSKDNNNSNKNNINELPLFNINNSTTFSNNILHVENNFYNFKNIKLLEKSNMRNKSSPSIIVTDKTKKTKKNKEFNNFKKILVTERKQFINHKSYISKNINYSNLSKQSINIDKCKELYKSKRLINNKEDDFKDSNTTIFNNNNNITNKNTNQIKFNYSNKVCKDISSYNSKKKSLKNSSMSICKNNNIKHSSMQDFNKINTKIYNFININKAIKNNDLAKIDKLDLNLKIKLANDNTTLNMLKQMAKDEDTSYDSFIYNKILKEEKKLEIYNSLNNKKQNYLIDFVKRNKNIKEIKSSYIETDYLNKMLIICNYLKQNSIVFNNIEELCNEIKLIENETNNLLIKRNQYTCLIDIMNKDIITNNKKNNNINTLNYNKTINLESKVNLLKNKNKELKEELLNETYKLAKNYNSINIFKEILKKIRHKCLSQNKIENFQKTINKINNNNNNLLSNISLKSSANYNFDKEQNEKTIKNKVLLLLYNLTFKVNYKDIKKFKEIITYENKSSLSKISNQMLISDKLTTMIFNILDNLKYTIVNSNFFGNFKLLEMYKSIILKIDNLNNKDSLNKTVKIIDVLQVIEYSLNYLIEKNLNLKNCKEKALIYNEFVKNLEKNKKRANTLIQFKVTKNKIFKLAEHLKKKYNKLIIKKNRKKAVHKINHYLIKKRQKF